MEKVLRTGRDAHQILGHDFFELLVVATGDRPGALVVSQELFPSQLN